MSGPNDALTLQLLEWISNGRHTYAEVLEAWHSTCPRLSIWEDACIAGLIEYDPKNRYVSASAKGCSLLQANVVGQGRGSCGSQSESDKVSVSTADCGSEADALRQRD